MGGAWNNRLFAASVGAFYDWAMQRERVVSGYLRLIVGASAADLFNAMDVVGEMPDRSAVLDVPCGGGVTLRRLRPGQHVRYVAADISPTMLQRARRHVRSQCNATVEFVQCNIEHMPFDDSEFDLVVCFSGLHCLPNPGAAVTEMARCLRPGGRLVADVAIGGRLRRTDVFMAFGRRAGIFGPSASLADV
jgi:SAM-dependent methyltransferase